ncbi:MAG: HlyD family efflux transporter periplasmic adaptor subunit [Chryseobacterium sp.]|nr:MAG: HlyD family efflux transporter periplasmic adaptor subunit [Chryseobacterium sp.]
MPRQSIYLDTATQEVQDIITAVPSWVIRWGITIVLITLSGIILASALIKSPDIIRAPLKINSFNSPKLIIAKQAAKISKLLVKEGDTVISGQQLAYLESVGDPSSILNLQVSLKEFRAKLIKNPAYHGARLPVDLNLGELQVAYQSFYVVYFQFMATSTSGYYSQKKSTLKKDMQNITAQKMQIGEERKIRMLEYTNAEQEYKAYQKLYHNKVVSRSEFSAQENKYLSSKHPIQQSKAELLDNDGAMNNKQKEILEIEHTISQERSDFLQSLNKLINEIESWDQKYILRSPTNGVVSFVGIVQSNQNLQVNQEVFIVNPGNEGFFGELQVPQYNMGKIKLGANTMIKLHSFPYEQYGMLRGKIAYISDVAYRDSVFIAKVSLKETDQIGKQSRISLKNGMSADAEIIAEESSLLKRFFRGVIKTIE